MDYRVRWEILEELGSGGQGKVYRVRDLSLFEGPPVSERIRRAILAFAAVGGETQKIFDQFYPAIQDMLRMDDPLCHGALKELHQPADARDAALAQERIGREIKAMRTISHPNLLKIIDADPDGRWFVSQFHPKGALQDHSSRYTGNFPAALKALRPLVEGVTELHKQGYVHRDIKPANIFIGTDDDLVLGDFGLVAFEDPGHTRISATWENVGSRDWMPGWAQTLRAEEIRPNFDVFSLGKVLWAMVSDTPKLPFWYFYKPAYDLAQKFPEVPHMALANPFLSKCVVENEEECLQDAGALLKEIDQLLAAMECGEGRLSTQIKRRCRVCGVGVYEQIVRPGRGDDMTNFGLNATSNAMSMFSCTHCGHVQMFRYKGLQSPPAWEDG